MAPGGRSLVVASVADAESESVFSGKVDRCRYIFCRLDCDDIVGDSTVRLVRGNVGRSVEGTPAGSVAKYDQIKVLCGDPTYQKLTQSWCTGSRRPAHSHAKRHLRNVLRSSWPRMRGGLHEV